MANIEKQYGYLRDTIEDDHFILGGLNLPIVPIQSTGQWDEFIPDVELQRNEKYETYNCTAFGTLNALEFLYKRLFGEKMNWSERYVGIASGTKPPGNSPHKIIETIRKDCGLLDDAILPMSAANTVEEYYSPDPLPWLMKTNGEKFLETHLVQHEWVWNDSQMLNRESALKEALRYSPIGIAVHAWVYDFDKKIYIRPKGAEDNHWCVLFGYEEGKFWKCYDSYNNSVKYLEWQYSFDRAKRFHLEKIEYIDWWKKFLNMLSFLKNNYVKKM